LVPFFLVGAYISELLEIICCCFLIVMVFPGTGDDASFDGGGGGTRYERERSVISIFPFAKRLIHAKCCVTCVINVDKVI